MSNEVEDISKELYSNTNSIGQYIKVFLTGYEGELRYKGLGLQVSGTTIIKPVEDWVMLVEELDRYRISLAEARGRIDKLQTHICNLSMEKD
jgi:hypothetical protein